MIINDHPLQLDFSNIYLDIDATTKTFFNCSTISFTETLSEPPKSFLYTVHQELKCLRPFPQGTQPIVSADFECAQRLLPVEKQIMLNGVIKWCLEDSTSIISQQTDQDLLLIHKSKSMPLPIIDQIAGEYSLCYCFQMTEIPSKSPKFSVNGESTFIFNEKSRVTRLTIPNMNKLYNITLDPLDNNLYLWFIRNGCKLNFDLDNNIMMSGYTHAVR